MVLKRWADTKGMTLIHRVINIVIHILMHTWFKIHTKIRQSEIYRDNTAKIVFFHLLVIADDEGNGIVTDSSVSEELGFNRVTIYKALVRCANKYRLIKINTSKKCTTFHIEKWSEYQSIGKHTGSTQEAPEEAHFSSGKLHLRKQHGKHTGSIQEAPAPKRYIEERREEKKEKEKKELSPIVSGDKTISGFEGGSLPQGSLPTTPSGARNLPPNSAHPPSSKKLVTIYNANSEPIQYEEVGKNLYKHLKTGSVNVGSFWSSVL